jgi:hypothetical protein
MDTAWEGRSIKYCKNVKIPSLSIKESFKPAFGSPLKNKGVKRQRTNRRSKHSHNSGGWCGVITTVGPGGVQVFRNGICFCL